MQGSNPGLLHHLHANFYKATHYRSSWLKCNFFLFQYRTINAECNNVKNPTWGITGAAYLRILQPMYEDGKLSKY